MTKIYSRFDVKENNFKEEQFDSKTSPSKTVPEQSLTLKEILERHVRGQYTPSNVGSYEEELEGFEYMSKIEQLEMMRENEEYIHSIRRELEEEENQRRQMAALLQKQKFEEEASLRKQMQSTGNQEHREGKKHQEEKS